MSKEYEQIRCIDRKECNMQSKSLTQVKMPPKGEYEPYQRQRICNQVASITHGYKSIAGTKCKRENLYDLIEIWLGETDSDPVCLMTMDSFEHFFLCGLDNWKDGCVIRIFPKMDNKNYVNALPVFVKPDVYENMYLKGDDDWLLNTVRI